jgi:hypothetical protein
MHDEDAEEEDQKESKPSYIPPMYYLRNFFLMTDSVLELNAHLFTKEEVDLLSKFKGILHRNRVR